jgi:SAM-dependent methyltransferase
MSFIYRSLIDPMLDSSHRCASDFVSGGDNVLDVACGAGTLAFMAGMKAKRVTAIDMDSGMLETARKVASERGAQNIEFLQMDATDLSSFGNREFDISIISMAIHQFDPLTGLNVLKEMKRVSEKVVVVDYALAPGKGLFNYLTWLIEWIAGGDHYLNFRLYMANGGIDPHLDAAGLILRNRQTRGKGTIHVSLCY